LAEPESGAYRYAAEDLERIRQLTLVRTLEHHRQIPSTNTRALAQAEDPALDLPALILADEQTAGRGRGANRWWSARGALTCSLILPRRAWRPASSWPRVALTAGLAICDSLLLLRPGLEIGLKWPNDVYVQSRKVCGILVEVPPRAPDRLVVGIGLNVNNSLQQAPPDVAADGIALIDVAGYPFDLTVVLIHVLQRFAEQLSALAQADATIVRRWQELCMLTGHRIQVEAGQRLTAGICRGINEMGALLVDTEQGTEACISGVVTVLDGPT
jgi:BirA family biotin operon repressor/biotin-[acetyl-CoA-carboxylase] ligase